MKTFKAGPDLDMLVANRVFLLKAGPCDGELEETDGGLICTRCFFCRDWRKKESSAHDFRPSPYSSSRELALQLLEKFPGGWLHHHDNAWQAGFDACPWSDSVMPGDKYTEPHETAALAICHAVLQKACMKDCGTCKGEGRIPNRTTAGYSEMCPGCHGAKFVSDGFLEAL